MNQSAGNTTSGLYTCVTCHVAFKDPENQRAHFQTEWHAYNLKRKVANMKPVTKAEFESKLEAQQVKDRKEEEKANYFAICEACNKQYASENAFTNHLQSKKHKENEIEFLYREEKEKKPKKEVEKVPAPEDMSEEEFIERQIATARRLTKEECIFCSHISDDFDSNLNHMTVEHSFFIPEVEYLVDLEGLIQYLGEKVAVGNLCLYCNGKGKAFYSLEAVQQHMLTKGHCKIYYEPDSEQEFDDFYDFRPSYPDYKPGENNEDEEAPEQSGPTISEDGGELILANGAKLGHRSLNRYFKQSFKPDDNRVSSRVNNLMGQYRALGWSTGAGLSQVQSETQGQAIDQLRHRNRKLMELGVRSNRLQRHFRRQVDF